MSEIRKLRNRFERIVAGVERKEFFACWDIKDDFKKLRDELEKAGFSIRDLAPEKTEAQIEQQIKDITRLAHQTSVQEIYNKIVTARAWHDSVKDNVNDLQERLDDLGWSLSQLEPGLTAAQVQKKIYDGVKEVYIKEARKCFSSLKDFYPTASDIGYAGYVEYYLTQAGVGYAALDPAGLSSEEKMRHEYETALKDAYWICAQNLYKSFNRETTGYMIDCYETLMRKAINKSGRQLLDLEPNSGFSDGEELMKVVRRKQFILSGLPLPPDLVVQEDLSTNPNDDQHMISARLCWFKMSQAEQPSKDYARSLVPVLRDHLGKAGKKLSDLFNGCSDRAAEIKLEYTVALAENSYPEKPANPRRQF